MLRRFHALYAIELELSDWDPAPGSPRSLRAIAKEVRLYCPTIRYFVFVQDYERSVVRFVKGQYIAYLYKEGGEAESERSLIDRLWKEIQSY